MRFSLFGVPIHVQPGFWLMAGAFGFHLLIDPQIPKSLFLIWMGVVFLSILVHEFGHALAIMRYRAEPAITLHMMGGVTTWQRPLSIGRLSRIWISFAGPLAGFLLAGVVFAFYQAAPETANALPLQASFALERLLAVNVFWGLFNLIPVVPFDGGHILEEALGPKRARLSAIISLIFGGLTALWFLVAWGSLWGTFLVGMAAMQSYQRLKNQPRGTAHPTAAERPAPAAPAAEPIPQELNRQLIAAEHALNAESFEQAGTIAELVLASSPPKAARVRALHILGWAYLLNGQPREAARVTTSIEKAGEVDLALVGAILRAKGELATAREVFEAARATGDDRKEIIGPLIQILIGEGEIARAAAIAFDIVESLSEDDAAEMARIAFEAGKHEWASRLFESMFERTDEASYAYDAARSRALEGDPPGALNLLRRAVAAGYSDAARAWSDSALERLRRELGDELESVLPRPS